MLDRFEKNCPDELRQRIHPVHADWDSLDIAEFKWERSFDLVTAYMTPAIRRPESLSENGIIKEKSTGNTGTLFWKICSHEDV